ncbi:MAG: Gfo/Idh/MocA family oxidoreductase [Lachnospiraceae bacterium]|jgi:predicted dehydrogenase|nr:Gfo/Idh/MocA family oxidoreductase [Lachnospiraceae bacterium]
MYKVGIMGSENSHAMAFAEIFNLKKDLYPDIEVVAVGGIDREASQKVQEKCHVAILAEKAEDMLGKVDAVMVTARDGKYHLGYARPFIEAGLPAFIDKPFTRSREEALELARLAQKHHVPLVGGSSVKYADGITELAEAIKKGGVIAADVAAPVNLINEYGGFFFYASHLAEVTMALFGTAPCSVTACQTPKAVTATLRYEGYDVTNHFNEGCYHYSATIYQKEQTLFKELDISKIYERECDNFAHMLRTGKMDQTYEELMMPVCYMEAVEKAYQTGVEQKIVPLTL